MRCNGHIRIFAILAVAAAICSCQKSQDLNSSHGDELQDVDAVLQTWSDNDRESALRGFLQLHHTSQNDDTFRVFTMSEDEVTELEDADREAWREDALQTSQTLRQFARFVHETAASRHEASQEADAGELIEALERLGRANTGEDLTKLANLIGEAILELSSRPLSNETE